MGRNVLAGKAASRCIAVLLAVAIGPRAFAAKPHHELTGRVVAIADGNTLTILDVGKTQHKIRLAGIDAPEKGQQYGNTARLPLADKVFGQAVRVEVIDVDRYKREVGRIFLDERFVNIEMVRDGFAWRYVTYDKPGEFTAAAGDARESRRGLWADPSPVPPWEWRRQRAKKRP